MVSKKMKFCHVRCSEIWNTANNDSNNVWYAAYSKKRQICNFAFFGKKYVYVIQRERSKLQLSELLCLLVSRCGMYNYAFS